MRDPYRVEDPCIISVSGGRTSGFMLRKILDSYGGSLPSDIKPVFCNTGLEHPATYDFLKRMGEEWCPITWLEYRRDGDDHGYSEVDYHSADRTGKPMEWVIDAMGVLPNPIARFCTAQLKIRTANRFARDQGWDEWFSAVGLRADEPRRAHRIKGDTKRDTPVCPMAEAGHGQDDVLAFWRDYHFDLELPHDNNLWGNCVGCFLKSRARIENIALLAPGSLEWWARQEEASTCEGLGKVFRKDRPTYRQIIDGVQAQGSLFGESGLDDPDLPCFCTD